MDGVTAAVMDLVKSHRPWPVLVNAVHPHPVQWNEIFNCINRRLGQDPCPVVPYKDWLQAVETIAAQGTPADLERVVSGFTIVTEVDHSNITPPRVFSPQSRYCSFSEILRPPRTPLLRRTPSSRLVVCQHTLRPSCVRSALPWTRLNLSASLTLTRGSPIGQRRGS